MNTEITDGANGVWWVGYDRDCDVCVRWARRWNGVLARRGFELVALQDDRMRERLGHPPEDQLLHEMRVIADGRCVGGADAVVYLADRIWWAFPLSVCARIPGVMILLRRLYRFIAKNRNCANGTCDARTRPAGRGASVRTLDVLPLFVGTVAIAVAGRKWPGWVYMWALAFAMFAGCKWLTFRQAHQTLTRPGRVAGYFLAWPGMDANAFLTRQTAARPALVEWLRVLLMIFVGAILIWFAVPAVGVAPGLAAGWTGMIGLVMVLHFGLFGLLSLGWRAAGVDARPLMNAPLAARSVTEFWGRRWNTGFHQLAHQFVFRPLCRPAGPAAATLAVFLVSGLIHDLVISLPARGGYGLPTLYFALQGAAVLFERTAVGKTLGVGSGWRGWLFTVLITAGPVFWLFHPAFIQNVMIPFLKAIQAF